MVLGAKIYYPTNVQSHIEGNGEGETSVKVFDHWVCKGRIERLNYWRNDENNNFYTEIGNIVIRLLVDSQCLKSFWSYCNGAWHNITTVLHDIEINMIQVCSSAANQSHTALHSIEMIRMYFCVKRQLISDQRSDGQYCVKVLCNIEE